MTSELGNVAFEVVQFYLKGRLKLHVQHLF
jgi:hypothetical protein